MGADEKDAMIVIYVGLAAVMAQAFKVVLESKQQGTLAWQALFLPGGMPSSHSACVTTLWCFVLLLDGWSSTSCAMASVLWGFMIYDAAVTRWQLGLHAAALNSEVMKNVDDTVQQETMKDVEEGQGMLMEDQQTTTAHMKKSDIEPPPERPVPWPLKSRMGHTPSEVAGGVAVGFIWFLFLIMSGVHSPPDLTLTSTTMGSS